MFHDLAKVKVLACCTYHYATLVLYPFAGCIASVLEGI